MHGTQICSWIPLDVAAGAIVDYRRADKAVDTVHLVHPYPRLSRAIFEVVAEHLDIPLVPFSYWVEQLSLVSEADVENVPALKLLEWLKADLEWESEGGEAIGIPPLHSEVAMRLSKRLRDAHPIQSRDVLLWLDYWRSVGFLPATKEE